MLHMEARSPAPLTRPAAPYRRVVKASRPAIVDLRFKGDMWVVACEHTATVRLGDFAMGELSVCPFDLPALNHLLFQVRLGQARHQYLQQLQRLPEA
ncbi:MAG: hypothetical protein U0736_00445 [Gemmataceae bacterium]